MWEGAKSMIDFDKKKMLPLTKELKIIYRCRCMLYLWNKILKKSLENINYWKVRDHCHYTGKYRGAAHNICNLKSNIPNEVPVVFHTGSNYDYHFIIRELANKF